MCLPLLLCIFASRGRVYSTQAPAAGRSDSRQSRLPSAVQGAPSPAFALPNANGHSQLNSQSPPFEPFPSRAAVTRAEKMRWTRNQQLRQGSHRTRDKRPAKTARGLAKGTSAATTTSIQIWRSAKMKTETRFGSAPRAYTPGNPYLRPTTIPIGSEP